MINRLENAVKTFPEKVPSFAKMIALLLAVCHCERSFKIEGDWFMMDGKKFQYVSGAFHYFRQHPENWESTLRKMANGGLSVVETYVPWNLHEPHKGEYYFDGFADIERWLKLVDKYNLYVILRPGPFICGEWDFGGLPYWLHKEKSIQYRRSDPVYLQHVDEWFTVLFDKLKPYFYVNGGRIIMVQVENEYGSFNACDQTYLQHIVDFLRTTLGPDVQLFTTDGPTEQMLQCGTIVPQAYATVDFRGDPTSPFQLERRWNGGHGPYVNSEFYPARHDSWGEKHNVQDAESLCASLDKLLSMGGSVNFYMYFGGTNFGLWNGANGDLTYYKAQPTSYDFDAPLSEAGDMTWKWSKVLDVIKKYRSDIPTYEVANSTKKAYGKVTFTEGVSLWDTLDAITTNSVMGTEKPLDMEDFDIAFGYAIYRTKTNGGVLKMPAVCDRAYVFVDRKRAGVVQHIQEKDVPIEAGTLEILVENQGRINYGPEFAQKKGLIKGATVGTETLKWDNIGFDLEKIGNVKWTKELPTGTPAFYRAVFNVDEVADTFLNPSGWTKGVVFINGFNCGRYWTIGPQLTLFIPSHLLHVGENELIVFEQEKMDAITSMSFDDVHQISIIE